MGDNIIRDHLFNIPIPESITIFIITYLLHATIALESFDRPLLRVSLPSSILVTLIFNQRPQNSTREELRYYQDVNTPIKVFSGLRFFNDPETSVIPVFPIFLCQSFSYYHNLNPIQEVNLGLLFVFRPLDSHFLNFFDNLHKQ